jgi:hypothetical protein
MLWMLLEGLRNEGNRNWYKYGCFWGDWQMNSGGVLKFIFGVSARRLTEPE